MKKWWHKIIFYWCISAGTLILYIMFLDNIAMPFLVDSDKIKIGNLSNQTFEEAQKKLKNKGLRLNIRDEIYHPTIKSGHIVAQSPQVGYLLKQGRQVFVDISRGVPKFAVPDLIGSSLRHARLRLHGIQLKIGNIVYTSSDRIPEGAIVTQNPPATTNVSKEHQVDLTISSGSPLIPKPVPHLIGLPIELVEDTLHKYEMTLGLIEGRLAPTYDLGSVLEQSLPSSAKAARGTPINLIISASADSLSQTTP